MIQITVQRPGTTLDLLLWRQHGVAGAALLNQALALNPGLADLGAELPLGTVLTLPELPAPSPAQSAVVVDLFGEA